MSGQGSKLGRVKSLSDGTTRIMGNLEVGGLNSNSALFGNILTKELSALSGVSSSAATLSIVSSSGSVLAGAVWTSALSVGNSTAGGTAIPAISSTSSLVGVWVVQGSASSFTRITWAAVQPGDQILTSIFPDAAQSSMSSGLVPWSHCTIAGFIELRLSNVSTLVQNQSSKSFYFTRISSF